MKHRVIYKAFLNFDLIKEELLQNVKVGTSRAYRGAVNHHTIKWINPAELPITMCNIKPIIYENIESISGVNVNYNDITYDVQYIEYDTAGDRYDWHVDETKDEGTFRRLTFALTLTKQGLDFIDGGFELSNIFGYGDNDNIGRVERAMPNHLLLSEVERQILLEDNSVVMFNPRLIHRALPITSGSRKVLTVWAKY